MLGRPRLLKLAVATRSVSGPFLRRKMEGARLASCLHTVPGPAAQ